MTTVLVSGLGFMGGSLAAALHASGHRVLLHHRRAEVSAAAAAKGWGEAVADPLASAPQADLAVICTPVSVIAAQVRALAAAAPELVVTDIGSSKGALCAELAELGAAGRFVGSHPMCGSHLQGLDHAQADLYAGATVVLTPHPDAPCERVDRIDALWAALACKRIRLTPEQHDDAVAYASHLPHVLASLCAGLADQDALALAATGFRDTTRVAAGSPELWCDILLENADAIATALQRSEKAIDELTRALSQRDRGAIEAWLEQGRQARVAFEKRQ